MVANSLLFQSTPTFKTKDDVKKRNVITSFLTIYSNILKIIYQPFIQNIIQHIVQLLSYKSILEEIGSICIPSQSIYLNNFVI